MEIFKLQPPILPRIPLSRNYNTFASISYIRENGLKHGYQETLVRITLADKIDSDWACQLADLLELPFISLSESHSTLNVIPSDDEDIDLICSKIMRNSSADIAVKGFFLNNYPHDVIQAKSLDMALARIGQPVSAALMLESSKISQNRIKSALIRYYRSQNKLILIDNSSVPEDICQLIHSIHDKRRAKKPA